MIRRGPGTPIRLPDGVTVWLDSNQTARWCDRYGNDSIHDSLIMMMMMMKHHDHSQVVVVVVMVVMTTPFFLPPLSLPPLPT